LITIENTYAATAHAPNHVTHEYGVKSNYIFWIPGPDLPIHYATSVALRWKSLKLSAKIIHGPLLKDAWVSAHARNHVMCWRCHKCLIAVVLVDVDFTVLFFKSWAYSLVTFTAIFSNICTAHAQKRLIMYFRCKFRHRRSIRRPRFPVRVQNFGDLATFTVDYCTLYSECPQYFYFRFVWPTDLESIPYVSSPTLIIPTSLKLIWPSTAELQRFCLLIRHVTWWPWPLTFWLWTVVIHGGSRDQPCHQVWRP